MKFLTSLTLLLILFLISCNRFNESRTERIQKNRDKVIDVADRIITISPEIYFGDSELYVIDSFLIINEISPLAEKGIHLLDKNNFKYVTSAGIIGNGPGEITNSGTFGIDKKNQIIWVPDRGKKILYKFPLDSILNNTDYLPSIKINMNNELFLARMAFINDSIALGKAVQWTSANTYEMCMAKLNTAMKILKLLV